MMGIEKVDSLIYLGVLIAREGSISEQIKERMVIVQEG